MQSELVRRPTEVGVQHAGFDPSPSFTGIDLTNPIHAHQRHDHAPMIGDGSGREPGSCSARYERLLPSVAILNDSHNVFD